MGQPIQIRVIGKELTERLLRIDDVLSAVDETFQALGRGQIFHPVKEPIWLGEGGANMLLAMPAHLKEKHIVGVKWVNMYPIQQPGLPASYGNLLGGNFRQDNASSPLVHTAYFYPNANVEREDFAVGIFNVFNLSDYGWKAHFPDIDQISWTDSYGYNYRQAACAMSNLGIMVGDGQGYFNPKQSLTRAELAQVLYNLDTNDSELLP